MLADPRATVAVVGVGTVSETVAVVVDTIRALSFDPWRRTTILRAVALILTWIATAVLTRWERSTIDFAIKAVLGSFAN